MPVSGTNIGQTFNQPYGTGTSEILDTSPLVNAERDIWAQENAYNKQTHKDMMQARNTAHKEVMTPTQYWQRDMDEILPEQQGLLDRWAKLMTRVNNPLEPSTDPEISKFQDDWFNFKAKAAQSQNDKLEYSKYQDDLRTKGASSFDEDSKKEVENYYKLPLKDRAGKVPPSMRLKNPNEDMFNYASGSVSYTHLTLPTNREV